MISMSYKVTSDNKHYVNFSFTRVQAAKSMPSPIGTIDFDHDSLYWRNFR